MEDEPLLPILPFFQSSNPKGCKEISETCPKYYEMLFTSEPDCTLSTSLKR